MSPARLDLLREVAAHVRVAPHGFFRLGIDGIDGAGKTTFADELAGVLMARAGLTVVRAGVDSFHRPRAERYRKGKDSPLGYFEDSFDYPLLRKSLLEPFAGGAAFRHAAFDHTTDSPLDAPDAQVHPPAVLLFDGIFLQRPELDGCFDLVVFLEVDFRESCRRCVLRDGAGRDLDTDPDAPHFRRYVGGQRHYLETLQPALRAGIVVDNNRVDAPRLLRAGSVT